MESPRKIFLAHAKKQKSVKLSVVLMLFISLSANLVLPYRSYAETEQIRLNKISQNCDSIKLQLHKIQKNDSKTRIRLGSYYEYASTKLIINLNLRLVKNNISSPDLTEQQSNFSEYHSDFKIDFVEYSQDLEALTMINCHEEPLKFYEKLEETRASRADLATDVESIEKLLNAHRLSVESLKKNREETVNE